MVKATLSMFGEYVPARSGSVLRASRQKKLRMEIVNTGLDLFLAHGFDNITVADIAERVDISRRTFFRHFQSKDDVVFGWMSQLGELVQPIMAERLVQETPLQAMERTFLILAHHLVGEGQRSRAVIQMIYNTPTLIGRYHDEHAQWEKRFISTLMQDRNLSVMDVFYLRIQVASAITAFVVAIRTWAGQGEQNSLEFWVCEAFNALFEGTQTVRHGRGEA
ncbi:TetR/AcrR family transcriptional regulator [Pseudomonas umsongensis]|uniref:TetR/AcrR family transcriptional regulator n=1 Tax=Pseudomonas umsongensis TaxID=198618 RepID=UPI00200AFAAE|nr:TetR family transcriptional regulator [Pseudomonas umsongensis]